MRFTACDRCDVRIEKKAPFYFLNVQEKKQFPKGDSIFIGNPQFFDLCEDCKQEHDDWMKNRKDKK